jgi:TatA/E family protein of Tat protein translocase
MDASMHLPAMPLAFVNSVWGWMVILFLGLLLFGSRLPGVARNMGKGINEFKKGLAEGASEDDRDRERDRDRDRDRDRPSTSAPRKTGIEDTSV